MEQSTGVGNNNTWVVLQVDLSTFTLYLGSPYLIYTDYNASYMEWYLPADWQDLGAANSTFDYELLGFEEFGFSVNPPGQFDYFQLTIWVGASATLIQAQLTPATEFDRVGGQRPVVITSSQPLGVMIVDYNGDPRNNQRRTGVL
jgi:hypothetical protein